MTESEKKYGGRVRVRVCGLLTEGGQLLLINHRGLGPKGRLWAPPGGGVDFQESAEEALTREFREETGLIIKVKDFLFVNEYLDDKYHAIELFFRVSRVSGSLHLGSDPELSKENQQITEIRWFSEGELKKMDKNVLHNVLGWISAGQKPEELSGFFKFENISVK